MTQSQGFISRAAAVRRRQRVRGALLDRAVHASHITAEALHSCMHSLYAFLARVHISKNSDRLITNATTCSAPYPCRTGDKLRTAITTHNGLPSATFIIPSNCCFGRICDLSRRYDLQGMFQFSSSTNRPAFPSRSLGHWRYRRTPRPHSK